MALNVLTPGCLHRHWLWRHIYFALDNINGYLYTKLWSACDNTDGPPGSPTLVSSGACPPPLCGSPRIKCLIYEVKCSLCDAIIIYEKHIRHTIKQRVDISPNAQGILKNREKRLI